MINQLHMPLILNMTHPNPHNVIIIQQRSANLHTTYQHRKYKKQETSYTPPPPPSPASPAVEASGGDGVLPELDCEDAAG